MRAIVAGVANVLAHAPGLVRYGSRPSRDFHARPALEADLAKHLRSFQALAPARADEPFHERILPRTVGRREGVIEAHALHAWAEHVAVDVVAIAEEGGRRGVVREGVHDLLGRPGRGGGFGHVEGDDAPAMGSEHDEDEEPPHARGGDREDIAGDEGPDVDGEERPPRLRRWCAPRRDQPGDCTLGHLDPQRLQVAVDAGRAPERVCQSHSYDKGSDLTADGRASRRRATGEAVSVFAEAAALPPQDRVRGHDHERRPPPGPDPGQPDPEAAISAAKRGPGHRSLGDGELPAQGEVLQGELAVAAAEDREESKQVEPEGDHRAGILPVQSGQINSLSAGWSFCEGQVPCGSCEQCLTVHKAGRLRPVIDLSFPLAAAVDAHRYVEGPNHFGKVVLIPEHPA